jgi:ADP-ribosylglycohydrolase
MSQHRREFMRTGLLAVAAAGLSKAQTAQSQSSAAPVSLREKFYGCIVGVYVGSAMGAPIEGWPWERIEREHGTLDKLLSYRHYPATSNWVREPGTTEDGVERQKLMINAILDKQDRVNAEDVRAAWVKYMNPDAPGQISEPFEASLLALAKTPMPAADIGKYCDYSGLVTLSRSCHPIGLINAGDLQGALKDIRDVGQLYNTGNSRGIRWAEAVVVAIAAATKPNATLDSVFAAVSNNCQSDVRREIERGVRLTEGCADFKELRKKFDAVYSGQGLVYANSYANEVVTKAFSIFRLTRGNTWEAMKAGVNFGRDTDCLTAVAAGISGSLSGAASLPEGLIQQVDQATSVNKYTCVKRTVRETSDGLYNAYKARLKKLREFVQEMDPA